MSVVKSMGLMTEFLIFVELCNNGARDLANSWSVGGRIGNVDVRMFFLMELKEDERVVFKHIPG